MPDGKVRARIRYLPLLSRNFILIFCTKGEAVAGFALIGYDKYESRDALRDLR
jgi:hypothetical protein